MLVKSPTGKEDPRITRTRNLILDAFMNSLQEKSFHALTVKDITGQAGINRGTFYSHFPDKYALLDFAIEQTFQQTLEQRTLNTCVYSERNLRELIVVVCEFVANAHGQCVEPEQQYESLVEAQVKKQLQELLQKWLEPAESEIDPMFAATAVSWAIYGLASHWHYDIRKNKGKLPAGQFADQIFPLIKANLAAAQTI